MTVHINIAGENAAEALRELRGLSAGLLGATSLTPPAPADLSPTETSDTSQDEAPKQTAPKGRGGRPKKETAQPTEVPADDKAQDAADEQAETEAAAPAEPELTRDDVRRALGEYSTKYGMEAVMEDGLKLMGYPNVSSVPEAQADLRKAVDALRGALETNPYDRKAVDA